MQNNQPHEAFRRRRCPECAPTDRSRLASAPAYTGADSSLPMRLFEA